MLILTIILLTTFVHETCGKTSYQATCTLGSEYSSNCQYWRVTSIIMLNDDSYSNIYLQQIQNFLDEVTQHCDTTSMMQLVVPDSISKSSCENYDIGSHSARSLIHSLTPSMTYPVGEPGTTLETMLCIMLNCSKATPLQENEGGVLFVFLDFPCSSLVGLSDLTASSILLQGFVVRVFLLSIDGNMSNCSNTFFESCSDVPSSQCDILVYDRTQNKSLSTSANSMMTCEEKVSGITTCELVVAIVVPCVSITSIFIACGVYCYRRTKKNNQSWRKFWKRQRETKRENRTSELRANALTTSLNFNILQVTSDDYEVKPKSLAVREYGLLGNGAFASVYKGVLFGDLPKAVAAHSVEFAQHRKEGFYEIAVKRLPVTCEEQSKIDFFKEMEFMKRIGYHKHIASILGCVSNVWDPMIVVEYCENGDLLRYLRNHRDDFSKGNAPFIKKDLVSFVSQVCDGMEYLSSRGYIHRDLAARNILVTKAQVIKISDFGLCRFTENAIYTARGGRLPIKWMAPESLRFYEFTTHSDIWSFGIMMWEVFTLGEAPYAVIQPSEILNELENGKRLPLPQYCPQRIYAIMMSCWEVDSDSRPSFVELNSEITEVFQLDEREYVYAQNPCKSRKPSPDREATTKPDARIENDAENPVLHIVPSLHHQEEDRKAFAEMCKRADAYLSKKSPIAPKSDMDSWAQDMLTQKSMSR